jgi:hypothetical protein
MRQTVRQSRTIGPLILTIVELSNLPRQQPWPESTPSASAPVNASPCISRCTTHDSGPVWFAIPSLHRTLTCYSLPISRRTSVLKIPFRVFSSLSSTERFGLVANCTDQTQKHRKLQKYISPTVSFRTKDTVRDGEHIVGADSTLHYPAFLPPGRIFAESFQRYFRPRQHK